MSERGTFEAILGEIGQALLPLREALRSPEAFFAFLQKLGWRGDGIPAPLADLGTGLDELFTALRKLLGDELNVGGSVNVGDGGASASASVSADDVMRVVNGVKKVVDGIRALAAAPDAAFPAHLVADGFKAELPRQLVNHLVIEYLQKYPRLARVRASRARRDQGALRRAGGTAPAIRPLLVRPGRRADRAP
jgi:hypothetical protein